MMQATTISDTVHHMLRTSTAYPILDIMNRSGNKYPTVSSPIRQANVFFNGVCHAQLEGGKPTKHNRGKQKQETTVVQIFPNGKKWKSGPKGNLAGAGEARAITFSLPLMGLRQLATSAHYCRSMPRLDSQISWQNSRGGIVFQLRSFRSGVETGTVVCVYNG